jgi:hypothetical protein
VAVRRLAAAPPPPPPARKPEGKPPHVPTDLDRQAVSLMVGGGIAQVDIARTRNIGLTTLRKHYRQEIETGATAIATMVILAHVKRIKAGDFQAIKWWEQARLGWSEHVVVDEGKRSDTPMRVIVELVGEAAPSRAEPSALADVSRMPDVLRKTVQLVG